MPSTHKIPEHVENHCEPCEFHKLVASFHTRSGGGSYREYTCAHPEALKPLEANCEKRHPEHPEIERLLKKLELDGRHIGKTEKQPEWCPLRRAEFNVGRSTLDVQRSPSGTPR